MQDHFYQPREKQHRNEEYKMETMKNAPPSTVYPTNGSKLRDMPSIGTYFADGKRKIDYVFIYEKDRKESLTENITSAAKKRLARKKKYRNRLADEDEESHHMARLEYFISNLVEAGLDTEIDGHATHHRKFVIVKLHATWDALCRQAEALRVRMPLKLRDPYEVEKKYSIWDKFWALRFLGELDDDELEHKTHVFWRFDRDHPDRFLIPENRDEFFSPIQREELVWEIMQECRNDRRRKDRRGLESLLEEGIVECAYPLHHGDYHISKTSDQSQYTRRQKLHSAWATGWAVFKPQPINRIRNYFGEKTAFYFAFMQFYTHSLLFPGLFGLMAFLYGIISVETNVKPVLDDICDKNGTVGQFVMCPICKPPACEPFPMWEEGCGRSKWQYRLDNEATLIVAILTVVWYALFVKYWKRRQARLACDWQTFDMYEMPGVIRPDYEERATEERLDAVTGEREPHVPMTKRTPWIAASAMVTLLLLAAAAACLFGLIAARISLYAGFSRLGGTFQKKNVEWSRWIVHLLIFIMIQIFEKLYHSISEKLTIWECPKTDGQFYMSLLWKVFVFAELVDFVPIAYAAWVKGRYIRTPLDLDSQFGETCEPGGCMAEVTELVAVLLLARLVVGNLVEFFGPYLKGVIVKRREKRRLEKTNNRDQLASGSRQKDLERSELGRGYKTWPQWLKDFQLDELELDGVSEELMEMMIQISFIVFFIPALTLAPLVCFINNVIEIRVDAINFLASHRRKTPERVPNLLIWNTFLDVILKVGVVVNAGLIAFTSEIVPRLYYKYRVNTVVSFVGYANFTLSRLHVHDWPALAEIVKEAQEKLKHEATKLPERLHSMATNLTTGHHARFIREVTEAAIREVEENSKEAGGEAEEGEAWLAGMTECRYFDYRNLNDPYDKTKMYWQVIAWRIATFALFAIGFYLIIYLINNLIKDVPSEIEKKIKRHQYIYTRCLEEKLGRHVRGHVSSTTGTPRSVRNYAGADGQGTPKRQREPGPNGLNKGGTVNTIFIGDDDY